MLLKDFIRMIEPVNVKNYRIMIKGEVEYGNNILGGLYEAYFKAGIVSKLFSSKYAVERLNLSKGYLLVYLRKPPHSYRGAW